MNFFRSVSAMKQVGCTCQNIIKELIIKTRKFVFYICLTHYTLPINAQCSLFKFPRTLENLWFSDVFRGYKKGTLENNALNYKTVNLL